MVVDRLPLAAECVIARSWASARLSADADIGQHDRRPRRVADADRDVAEAMDVGGRLGPLVLHDHQHAEAELAMISADSRLTAEA